MSTMTLPAVQFLTSLQTHAADVVKAQKACILLWLGGGPPTIDMWDLKPGSRNGGEFKPIATTGDMMISELLPRVAKQMKNLSLLRSMSTVEADHGRGRYFMHTAYRPNPTVAHPGFGSVVSYELGRKRPNLEIPAFVAVGGGTEGPGFLGMAHAAFSVDATGRIRNSAPADMPLGRLKNRLAMLNLIETSFIRSGRGEAPKGHQEIYGKAVNLMTSSQMKAFQISEEDARVQEAYGATNIGRGCLMARRLVQAGVPFVEVGMGGWDLHQNVFASLRDQRLPPLDQAISTLVADLEQRGMLEHTVIVCMGEFGRTPRINANTGRDHWARSWSALVGGGGLKGGQAIGETDKDGLAVIGKSYLPGDLWATVGSALGIPGDTVYTSKRGRPMKLANGGTPIKELI